MSGARIAPMAAGAPRAAAGARRAAAKPAGPAGSVSRVRTEVVPDVG